ncbi:MAG: PAS domain-containing sensor histidine kinase [Burkholderiaceae bacterium]|nr:PAS domain-containing sensor histidine kinase [Burkholderiaceae bacterium]
MDRLQESGASHSWFGAETLPPPLSPSAEALTQPPGRLWHGFMTARVVIALVLLAAQVSTLVMGQSSLLLLGLCIAYLVATVAMRMLSQPRGRDMVFDPRWVATIGLDVATFSALHFMQGATINYTPLFALPVLQAAVLGALPLALGTTALVTLILLADAWRWSMEFPADTTTRMLQSGLAGAGLFIVAYLTNHLALRLSRQEAMALQSAREARVQMLVNELVIEHLSDGVLVIDQQLVVNAANPSARHLLEWELLGRSLPFALDAEPGWTPLADLVLRTFALGGAQRAELNIQVDHLPVCHLQARTQLADALADGAQSLCVLFLQDRREMEARMRTEKLAAMGRMSAAVAHEIRNPLASISQANALLGEELADPAQQRLVAMVQQNAQRLSRIVDEILDVARVEHLGASAAGVNLPLDDSVRAMCGEWTSQHRNPQAVLLSLAAGTREVRFDPEHLRRVLVNLLDNAWQHADHARPIQVSTSLNGKGAAVLQVWSEGPQLEQTVQRHLFEPFFSSRSRSSGLGLYICRELCERHRATISHERLSRYQENRKVGGNAFTVTFESREDSASRAAPVSVQ